MESLTFSEQIGNFFNTAKDGMDSVSLSSSKSGVGKSPTTQLSSEKNKSDVFILLNTQQCEFNIGMQEQSSGNSEHIKKEPDFIVIDSDDEDFKEEKKDTDALETAVPPVPEYVMPIQSVYLPEKHFLSQVNEEEAPADEFDELLISSNICDYCGKARSLEFVNGSQESSELCECANTTAYSTEDCEKSTGSPKEDLFTSVQESGISFTNTEKNPHSNIDTRISKGNGFSSLTCPNCGKIFINSDGLKMHCDFHCKAGERKKVVCKICSNLYAGPRSLMIHMNKKHKSKISYKSVCSLSGISLSSKKKAKKSNVRYANIQTCNALKLCEQVPMINDEESYVRAESRVKSNDSLSQHKFSDAEKLIYDNVDIPKLKISDTYKHVCEKCEAAFSLKSQLLEHHKLHTAVEISSEKSNVDISEKENGSSQDEPNTNRTGLKQKFPKKSVDTSFENVKRYKSKNNLRATGLLKFFRKSGYGNSCFCPICGKYVYSPSFLNVHMRKHTNEKPFSCRKCSKGFFTKVALKYHSLTKCPKRTENSSSSNSEENLERRPVNSLIPPETTNKRNTERPKRSHETLSASNESPKFNGCRTKKTSREKIVCQNCKMSYSNIGNLQRHNLYHCSSISQKAKVRFTCSYCKNSYSSEFSLKRHILAYCSARKVNVRNSPRTLEHSRNVIEDRGTEAISRKKEKKYDCSKCEKCFTSLIYLKRHKCQYYTGTNSKLEDNVKVEKQEAVSHFRSGVGIGIDRSQIPFLCGTCKKSFKYPSVLQNHIAVVHKNETEIICKSCKTEFNDFKNFRNHLVGGSRTGYVCCKIKQSIIGNFKCKKCGKTFNLRSRINSHVRKCNITKNSVRTSEIPQELPSFKPSTKQTSKVQTIPQSKNESHSVYMCSECSTDFKYPSELKRHIELVHRGVFNQICITCSVKFNDYELYKRHFVKESWRGKYVCSTAKDTTNSEKDQTENMSKSVNENVFICNVCNCKFPTIPVLVQHLQKHMMVADDS